MIVGKFLRQPLVSLLVAYHLFLLPRLSESCVSCFHPGSISNQHKAHQQHGHAITTAASSRGLHPYGRTNTIAIATTAARQALEMCKERFLNLQQSLCTTIPRHQRALRLSASAAIVAGGMIVIARHHVPATTRHRLHRGLWRNELPDDAESIDQAGDENAEPSPDTDEQEASVTSSAMIATIGIYKNFISPLLPPACRFLPTCSQYGVQAIEKYGPGKGVILTSWRLLRCSPFGGKGYDPPKWPPVSYTYSSY